MRNREKHLRKKESDLLMTETFLAVLSMSKERGGKHNKKAAMKAALKIILK
jgi:hypothetical protein